MNLRKRITSTVNSITRLNKATIHGVDLDRVDIRFGNSATVIRGVEVIGGTTSEMKKGEEISVLWRNNRPVAIAKGAISSPVSSSGAGSIVNTTVNAVPANFQSVATKTMTTVDSGTSGWVVDPETWVYVAGNQFKVSGIDVRERYPLGTKFTWIDGGVNKFGFALSSSYGTDTTVTIGGDAIANATITTNYYSYADCPQDFTYPLVSRLSTTALSANSLLVSNVTDPVGAQDAATKNYVDTHSGGGVSLGVATPQPIGTAAVGSSTSASHENHVHAHGNQLGGTLHSTVTTSATGFCPILPGTTTTYLRGDGTFTTPPGTNTLAVGSATPQTVGTAAVGTATAASHEDHAHAHGTQAGGTAMHPVATTSVAGFCPILSNVSTQFLNGTGSFSVPSGTNTLALGAATPSAVGAAATGTATAASHEDHVHAHGAQIGGTTMHPVVTTSLAGFCPVLPNISTQFLNGTGLFAVPPGTNTLALGSAAPGAVGTAATGTAIAASHEDHVHAHGNQLGGTLHATANTTTTGFCPVLSNNSAQFLNGTGAFTIPPGTNTLSAGSATPISLGSAAAGTATAVSHEDHVHAHDNQAGGSLHPITTTSLAGFCPVIPGDSTKYLDGTGTFSIPPAASGVSLGSATPQAVGTATVGTATNASHEDHVHAHGSLAGGSLHSTVTTSATGFCPMLPNDSTKFLNGVGSFTVPATLTAATSVTSETSYGLSSVVGTSTNYARQDHTHGSPADPGVKVLSHVTTTVTVTTPEAALWSFSLPGGTLGTSGSVHVRIVGTWHNTNASSKTLPIYCYYGSSQGIVFNYSIGTTNQSRFIVDFDVIAKGATNAQEMIGLITLNEIGSVQNVLANTGFDSAITIDSTVAQTIKVTANTTDAAFSILCYDALCEYIPAK